MFLLRVAIFGVILLVAVTTGEMTRYERDHVQSFMFRFMAIGGLSGASLALVKEGEVVYTGGFGWASLEKKRLADADTVFCLASVTETFTATMLAKMLALHQNYTWDTPVRRILGPTFALVNNYVSRHVTVRDIMVHRTGVSSMDGILEHKAASWQKIVQRLIFAPQMRPFRSDYLHSRVMIAVIQAIVENLGNSDWETLVSQYLLKPLGMTRSTYFVNRPGNALNTFAVPTMKMLSNATAVPWKIARLLATVPAGGSICSSANDMGKWVNFHLEKGRTNRGERIHHEDWLQQTYDPEITLYSRENYLMNVQLGQNAVMFDTRDSRGLGWTTGYYEMFKVLTATGSWYGYESYISLIPDRKIGVWLAFTGQTGQKAEALKRLTVMYMQSLLLRGKMPFRNDEIPGIYESILKLVPQRKSLHAIGKEASQTRPRELYVGTYGNGMFGYINISLTNDSSDRLLLEYGHINSGYFLSPTGAKDEFYMHPRPGPLMFYTKTFVEQTRGAPIVYFTVSHDPPGHTRNAAPTSTTSISNLAPTAGTTFVTLSDGSSGRVMAQRIDKTSQEKRSHVRVISVVISDFDELAQPVFMKDFNIEDALVEATISSDPCAAAADDSRLTHLASLTMAAIAVVVVRLN